jgi:hypothetical protein
MGTNDTETMLEERDLYVLGVFAERAHERAIGTGPFQRGSG